MGNMIVILAALLFNGFIGGISGSVGMGLFDALNGYGFSVPKTLILKFGIGIVTGTIARKGRRDNTGSPVLWIGAASAVFLAAGSVLLAVSLLKGNVINIQGVEKPLVINPVLYIFSLILGSALAAAAILSRRYPVEIQYAILGAVAGIAFNLAGEFTFYVFYALLAGTSLYPAVLAAAVSLPATLINGVFSIIAAIALYIPISRALGRINFSL